MRIVVLGAGFGGLEVSARLSAEFGDDLDLILIDKHPAFVFGFSKLDVMFGHAQPAAVRHRYSDIDLPGVRFVQSTVRSIDPTRKRVETSDGFFDADVLVVALGADLHPEATPGLIEGGHEFYTVDGAFALRDVLNRFEGGNVVIAVTSTPFKCPPAPSETALLLHDFLRSRGLRDRSTISLVMPFGMPIPPSPQASQSLLQAFTERGIAWIGDRLVRELDPQRHVARLADGDELEYDLFLGVPTHRVPAVIEQSGLAVDGWIPVDPKTLETAFADVYAIGDATSVGTPKAGVFAEGQGAVVADAIRGRISGRPGTTEYDGRGVCYLEFGHGKVARVDVTFLSGERPTGDLEGPSLAIAGDKREFESSRIARWFAGRSSDSDG